MAATFVNPFIQNGGREFGKPWVLPPASDVLSQLNTVNQSGFGCVLGPSKQLGLPLEGLGGQIEAASPETICSRGFFCPYLNVSNAATFPVSCPATPGCYRIRQFGSLCDYPQGVFEPMACPPGFYCPTYNTVVVCPAGHYCKTGSSQPTPCDFLSICPAGTVLEQHYGLLIIVGAADILLLLAYLFIRCTEIRKSGGRIFWILRKKVDENQQKRETIGLVSVEKNIQALVSGFQKGLHGSKQLVMNYDFDDLGLTLPDGKQILKGVTGSIQAGKMTAIIGPSGAGKTTFMSVLMGRVSRTSGVLKINDETSEMKYFRKIIGYVPQEDVMIEELTVRENIRYAARVRLPSTWSNAEVDEHVDALLKSLNLEHVAHKRIGNVLERGISGGQRKRVNIGIELAAAPLSLFLDEPTSGLDSTSALDVANILHSISRLNLTVVAVIHQPRAEIFSTFDDVLMIVPGGLTAYFGPVTRAQKYFESLGFIFHPNTNSADILMDILAGRGQLRDGIPSVKARPNSLVESWNNYTSRSYRRKPLTVSIETVDAIKKVSASRGASFLRQILLSHNRSLKQQLRLVSSFVMEAFVGFLTGLIMGIASGGGENYNGIFVSPFQVLAGAPKFWFLGLYGLLIGISISLAATPSGVKVFGEEKAMYIREHGAGHSSTAYFIGKNLSSLYRVLLSSAHFVAIYVFLSQPPMNLGIQYALIFLNFLGMYGVGMIISMMVRRENASLLAVTIGLISEVLCGFGPNLNTASNGGFIFLFDIGVNRWAAETQFTQWIAGYADIFDVDAAVEGYGYSNGKLVRNMVVMTSIVISYRVVTYLLFLYTLNYARVKQLLQRWFVKKPSASIV